jgi:hypothetical protein
VDDIIMPRRSLLDIASGGQYKTSKELPSFSDLLSVIEEYQSKEMSKEVGHGVTQGDLYEIVTGTAGIVGAGRGIVKAGVKAVKKLRSIQKLKIQKETVERLSRHSMSKEGAIELRKISSEIDNYLGPQRSARIVKQGGNVNAPSIRQLDRKKYKSFEERLDALSRKEGGVVRVEYKKGSDLSPQTAKILTSKQKIEREKLREEKRLFQELGGSQRGRSRKGVF